MNMKWLIMIMFCWTNQSGQCDQLHTYSKNNEKPLGLRDDKTEPCPSGFKPIIPYNFKDNCLNESIKLENGKHHGEACRKTEAVCREVAGRNETSFVYTCLPVTERCRGDCHLEDDTCLGECRKEDYWCEGTAQCQRKGTKCHCFEGKKWCQQINQCIQKFRSCCQEGEKWCEISEKCVSRDESCCGKGKDWCQNSGVCVREGENCDCGEEDIWCQGKCVSQGLFEEDFKACGDGRCVRRTQRCSEGSCEDRTMFECGSTCKPIANFTVFKECFGSCVKRSQICEEIGNKTTTEITTFAPEPSTPDPSHDKSGETIGAVIAILIIAVMSLVGIFVIKRMTAVGGDETVVLAMNDYGEYSATDTGFD